MMRESNPAGPVGFHPAALTGDGATRFYNSDEIGLIAGISPEKQRLWRSRGLVAFDGREEGLRGRVHNWQIVTRWAIAGELVRQNVEIESAANFAAGPSDSLLTADQRRPEGNHLFLFCSPTAGEPASYRRVTSTTLPALGGLDPDLFGRFVLLLNFSALQTALMQRVQTL